MSDIPPEQKLVTSAHQLEYDFFKFFGLVSLLVLSGVITLAAAPISDRLPGWVVPVGAVLSVVSATISFASQVELVRIAKEEQARRVVTAWAIPVLAVLFLIAMGMFLLVALSL